MVDDQIKIVIWCLCPPRINSRMVDAQMKIVIWCLCQPRIYCSMVDDPDKNSDLVFVPADTLLQRGR